MSFKNLIIKSKYIMDKRLRSFPSCLATGNIPQVIALLMGFQLRTVQLWLQGFRTFFLLVYLFVSSRTEIVGQGFICYLGVFGFFGGFFLVDICWVVFFCLFCAWFFGFFSPRDLKVTPENFFI